MNFLYTIYFALPNFESLGIIGKGINRFLSLLLKKIFDSIVPGYLRKTSGKAEYGLNIQHRDKKFIVSLTSFPARINDVWITIETIMRQSFKPDKIILWLAEEQFPDHILPESLTNLKNRGLTIEFCDDLRSHKKYFYSMLKYPNEYIITVDDDLYYPSNLIMNVVDLHHKYSGHISTNRAHKIVFTDGIISPYRKWKHNVTDTKPSKLLVPTGGAGTLYPPGTLHPEAFNKDLFKSICLEADDLWLKVMALKKGTPVVTNRRFNKDLITIGKTQKQKLVSHNVIDGGNDIQLKNVLDHYKINIADEIKGWENIQVE